VGTPDGKGGLGRIVAVSWSVPLDTLITDDPDEAALILQRGGLVAFPTETVYGLGGDATRAEVIARIFRAKGRPSDNPLIVHVSSAGDIGQACDNVPESALRLLEAFAPGPITVVVPRTGRVAPEVSAGLDTVAVRIPSHPIAQALIKAARIPVAAPSANRSGRPSATTWTAVRDDLDGLIDAILTGDRPEVGIESTVVDCTVDPPAVLRAGGVSLEELRRVWPGLSGQGKRFSASPGTRHPHYAPRATVEIVAGPCPTAGAAYIGLESGKRAGAPGTAAAEMAGGYAATCLVKDTEEYAHHLYNFFRQCDAAGVKTIHCQRAQEGGLGRALSDRINRAAATGP
jgi:L-threonylcarbamoyladenylate synthase